MTDDLVKRLRCDHPDQLTCDAADRIEELEDKLNWVIVERDETFALMLDRAQTAEAKLSKSEALLAKAVEALDDDRVYGVITHTSLATLAELKGEK